jgi:hypothetical protein
MVEIISIDWNSAWNTSTLNQLCTSACNSSLIMLSNAVNSGCQNEQFNIGGQNMTFTNLTDFVRYKYGLICLAEDSTGKYCSDVEER